MENKNTENTSEATLDLLTEPKKLFKYFRQKMLHDGVKRYANSMSWMFFAKLASMVISFIATAYIARTLGPSNYGELSYAISFVGIFSFFASLGLDQVLHRDLIKYPEKKNEYLGSAISLRVLASFFAIIFCLFWAIILSPKDISFLLIFIISFTHILGSFQLLSYEFQANAESKYPSILLIATVFTLSILKILVAVFDKGVIYLSLIILLEPILYSLGYMYLKKKFYKDLSKIRFNATIARSLFKDSFPLIFASAFYIIYTRIDQVMIKNIIDAEAVGLYDSSVRISELIYFIPQIILTALLPAIINAKKVSLELYYRRIKKLIYLVLAVNILTASLVMIFAPNLIAIIFGAGFLAAVPVLYIYAWSNIGAAFNFFAQQILIIENKTKNILVTTFLGMACNVLLNLMLIPRYGISGAATATLISYLVPFLSLFLFKHTRILLINIIKS